VPPRKSHRPLVAPRLEEAQDRGNERDGCNSHSLGCRGPYSHWLWRGDRKLSRPTTIKQLATSTTTGPALDLLFHGAAEKARHLYSTLPRFSVQCFCEETLKPKTRNLLGTAVTRGAAPGGIVSVDGGDTVSLPSKERTQSDVNVGIKARLSEWLWKEGRLRNDRPCLTSNAAVRRCHLRNQPSLGCFAGDSEESTHGK
jgi:hypothetical protein